MRFAVADPFQKDYQAFLDERSGAILDCLLFVNEEVENGILMSLSKGANPCDLTVLSLVRHIIEALDAVSVLVSKGCIPPCQPLLRSGFETLLGIYYILEADSSRRGLAYMLADDHRTIKHFRRCDPDDDLGKEIRRELEGDIIGDTVWNGVSPVQARKAIADLKAHFQDAEFKPVENEWQRMKKARKNEPQWYSLFGGPKDMRQLAAHFSLLSMYETMYRQWSSSVHAESTQQSMHGSNDTLWLRPIRHPDGIANVVRFAGLFGLLVAWRLVEKYAPKSKQAKRKRYDELYHKLAALASVPNTDWGKYFKT